MLIIFNVTVVQMKSLRSLMFRYIVKSVVSFGEIHVNYPFLTDSQLAQIAAQIAMRIHINTPLPASFLDAVYPPHLRPNSLDNFIDIRK